MAVKIGKLLLSVIDLQATASRAILLLLAQGISSFGF